jgi:hypothetical protein
MRRELAVAIFAAGVFDVITTSGDSVSNHSASRAFFWA